MEQVIGVDISFYQGVIDYTKLSRSKFTIIRAGQNLWVDSTFSRNWAGAKMNGTPRGNYWFYDSRANPLAQAQKWVSILGNDFGELPLFADFEDRYSGVYHGWRHWKTFLEELKRLVGNKEIEIYTAYYYWKENTLDVGISQQDLEYFHQYKLWIANYGVSFPSIPKPWTAGEWEFWQYQSNEDNQLGSYYGVDGDGIDLNYFNGTLEQFIERFNLTEIPPIPNPPDYVINSQEGVTLHKIIRFGALVWVHVIDITRTDLWVSGKSDDFQTVVQTVTKNNSSGGSNGGGWKSTSPFNANEIWKSRNILIQTSAKDNRPWVGFTLNKQIVFGRGVPPSNVIDVVGYDRYLIEDGMINPALYSDTPGKDARTFSGRSRDGKFVLCACEGDDRKNYGLSFLEEYEILKEFNVDIGGNHDGGSSTTIVNTAVASGALNVTSDPELAFVINSILWRSIEPPLGGNMQYKVTWPDGASVRSAPNTGSPTQRVLSFGTVVDVIQDNIVDSLDPNNVNKRWVKLVDGNYAASNYPDGVGPKTRMTLFSTTPPPSTHSAVADVSINIDGEVYRASNITLIKQ